MTTQRTIGLPDRPTEDPKPRRARRATPHTDYIPRGSAPTAPLNVRLTYRALERLEKLRDDLVPSLVRRPSRSVTISMLLEGLCDMDGNVRGRIG